ncbi:MAG: class I SAM-dependent rRNA methyltransferase [Gemmatimonadota bacterium]
MTYPQLLLRPNSERLLLKGHPWVYSGAVARAPADTEPGGIVDVVSDRGRFVGRGYYNASSTIAVRLLTRDPQRAIDSQFLVELIERAVRLRREDPLLAGVEACRLVHGESDGLPGLIVDEYAGFLVLQLHTWGMERLRAPILEALATVVAPRGVYERSDVGTRRADGLRDRPTGPLAGEEPPELIAVNERGVRLLVDVRRGQKTGLFIDQRENRCLLQRLATDRTVLNCFAFTGGFSAHALKGGARRVVDVDIAPDALHLGRRNLEANASSGARLDQVAADVFPYLDHLAERGPRFDIVVLDPPSMVRKARDVKDATGVYIKLNRNALRLVRDGGYLLTASCSSRIEVEDFFQIVRRAAAGARVTTRILTYNQHPSDHPLDPAFPEGRYLKAILARVFRP